MTVSSAADEALIAAVRNNDFCGVQELLAKNANPNVKYKGMPLLSLIICSSSHFGPSPLFLELLKANANINELHDNKSSVAINCCIKGCAEYLKLVIEHQADLGYRDSNRMNALMWSAHRKELDCLNLLIENGVSLDEGDEDNNTALILAISSTSCLKSLINAGADVNAVNRWGRSALMQATVKSEFENVKLLIEHGADIFLLDNDNESAKMLAARVFDKEIVEYLVACEENILLKRNIESSLGENYLLDLKI